ncbi:hypothetical protein LCGC14_0620460, partial [marine sediment metagenome]
MGIININVVISEETITSTYSPNRVYVGVGGTISIIKHNLFPDLQGGADDEYYHLTLADYDKVGNDAWVLTTGDVMTGTLQINVPTATSEALILKSTDDDPTKNLLEMHDSSGVMVANVKPLGGGYFSGNVAVGVDLAGEEYFPTELFEVVGGRLRVLGGSISSAYAFTLGDPSNGPRLQLGTKSEESKYFTLGAYGSIINFDTYTDLSFKMAGSEKMRLTSDGDVGIGIVAPDAKFHIKGADVAVPIQIIQAAPSQTANLQEWQNSSGTALTVVDKDGHIGIGTDPYSGLHYQGDILYLTPAAGAESNDNIIIKNYATGNGAPDIILRTADINGAYGIGVGVLSLIGGSKTTHYGGIGGGGGEISLQGGQGRDASNDPSGYAPVLLQSNGGNVGIGTSSPQKELHIESGVPTLRMSDSNAVTDLAVATLVEFYRGNNTSRVGFVGMESSSNNNLKISTDYAAGKITLGTGSNVTALTIDATGNVLINGFTASTVGLTVKAAPAQTTNLQEWQNSSGVVLGNVAADGKIVSSLGTDPTNQFFGGAGNLTMTGNYNTANGMHALRSNTEGIQNTANGYQALRSNTIGNYNTANGYQALYSNTIGNYNVALGYAAGYNELGSNTLYIANSITATPLIYGLFTGAGAGVTIYSQHLAGVPLIIKGIASQSSNLQEWQNSSSTVLAAIDPDGDVILDKAQGRGIMVDTTTPTYGWRDLLGEIFIKTIGSNDPEWVTYRGSIRQYRFTSGP